MNVSQPALPTLAGVEHRDVWVRGVRLHVAESGEGPPLILLHGWPQHWWCWRHLIPRLAERFRVLAPDLRGWGWSDAPPGDYAKSAFADDVLALLDVEGLERARVIGHDWGGYAAFLLALSHPERVERLVALDIPPPWRGKAHAGQLATPLFLSYQLVLATPGLGTRTLTAGNRFVRTVIRAGSGRGANWSDAELDVYADVLRDPARAAASSACYRTFLLRELPATLRGAHRPSELDVPTLIVMGAASPVQRVAAPQPSHNLRVERIRGAGHFLPEEAPERVLELALPFFAG
ncbi:MAG: alpha/beta fold hydrolase [Solirubrobacterales bacterium]|nr:alpha/beta fold hydrolase [Solirubrobacterales bacterium]